MNTVHFRQLNLSKPECGKAFSAMQHHKIALLIPDVTIENKIIVYLMDWCLLLVSQLPRKSVTNVIILSRPYFLTAILLVNVRR